MVKSKVSNQAYLSTTFTVILGLLLLGIANYVGTWGKSIYGYNPPIEIANSLHWTLSVSVGLLGLSVLFNFRKLTNIDLFRMLTMTISLFLFIFGWALTSTSLTGQIQNDGFNVTGGFMMFFSGLYTGYVFTTVHYKNLLQKAKGAKNGKQ